MSGTRNYKLEKQKQWVKNNPEKIKIYQKRYNEKHPDKLKTQRLNWKNKNPNYHKEWYLKNKERILQQQKEYVLKNKDKKLAYKKKYNQETHYNKKYYAKNKERLSEYHKEYHIKNRETLIKKMRERYDPIKRREDYIKNREKNLERVKEWRVKNAEYVKQYRKEFEARPERKAYLKRWNKDNPKSRCSAYPLELEIAMNQARKRDNNTCQWQGCGLTHRQAPIDVHHIFPRSEYPEYELEGWNLICYCLNHHVMFHKYRGDQVWQLLASRHFENPLEEAD